MKKICYTVITGGYDTIKEPEVITPGWEYIAYVDELTIIPTNSDKPSAWQFVGIGNPNAFGCKKKLSRYYKCFASFYPKKTLTIYVDANMRIIGNLDELVYKSGHAPYHITAVAHQSRNCIYDEIDAVQVGGLDNNLNLLPWMLELDRRQYPVNAGLNRCGMLIRTYPVNNRAITSAMAEWWSIIREYTHRDQCSFNYVIAQHPALTINSITKAEFGKYFKIEPHTKLQKVT